MRSGIFVSPDAGPIGPTGPVGATGPTGPTGAAAVIANTIKGQFWYPPDVAHTDDLEFDSAGLGILSLVNTATWGVITPTAAAPTSASSPASNTVRLGYAQKRSHVSIQPAPAYSVGLYKNFAPTTRPSDFQVWMRGVVPVPYSAVVGDVGLSFCWAADSVGTPGTPDPNNLATFTVSQQIAANNTTIRAYFRNAGSFVQSVDSASLDSSPADWELGIRMSGSTLSMYMRSGSMFHAFGSLTLAVFAAPTRQHMWITMLSSALSTSLMPVAPIFHIDYVRFLNTAEVY